MEVTDLITALTGTQALTMFFLVYALKKILSMPTAEQIAKSNEEIKVVVDGVGKRVDDIKDRILILENTTLTESGVYEAIGSETNKIEIRIENDMKRIEGKLDSLITILTKKGAS